MPSENLLLIADSEKDADMLYTTDLFVLDSRLAGAMVIWRVMGKTPVYSLATTRRISIFHPRHGGQNKENHKEENRVSQKDRSE